MAENVSDVMHEAIQLHGLVIGLNILMNEGGPADEAIYPLGDLIQEKSRKLADDLEKIEGGKK